MFRFVYMILLCSSIFVIGISKFSNFSFDPIGRSCNDQEEYHKVSVGFLNSKNQAQAVNWLIIFGTRSPQSPVSSEIEVRTTFIPDLHRFLSSSSYKRAKYLFNIPELIYHEEKIVGQIHKQYLVIEDIQITKKCNPSPPYLVQVTNRISFTDHFLHLNTFKAGMDLTHLNLILSTLAQFHAVSIAWKQSLEDDSILDIYPFLSKPPCPNISVSKRSSLLLSYRKILEKIHNNSLPEKVEQKLILLQRVCDGIGEPLEAEVTSVLGTVGLGCVSPLHLAFQVSLKT